MCFVVTKSFLLTCCLPIFLMGMRYYFSRKVILHYLDCALHTDMSDIEQYYMKPPGECESPGLPSPQWGLWLPHAAGTLSSLQQH